ncbi:XisI protein [filamentous cyanobacterium LEGE 11480]|uniref:XisI protein n=1 Tax=Romeriopsis navalis LEGE 11480 TaxID=2777977 RepID=A0A928Z629_9CYAN|nr:XisI protein [Romeriopsis navalis]MBE9032612.1 XisI protein [Romeriopsis navalis LEGE 11480]
MDRLLKYREIIRQILDDNAQPYNYSDDVEPQLICDTEHDHYQLIYVGWEAQQRVFGLVLHFDIKDGKIWVQYNGTELPIARILTEKGVPESDIVLGFHSPFKRQFSGYAVS